MRVTRPKIPAELSDLELSLLGFNLKYFGENGFEFDLWHLLLNMGGGN